MGDSAYMLNWTTWGQPNPIAEPVFQAIWPRTSKNIWHEGSLMIEVGANDTLISTVLAFRGSDFPSHKLWLGSSELEYLPQGPFSSLWRRDPPRGAGRVTDDGTGPFFPN
jgi:hypothetical protein